MNINALQEKLLAAARAHPPSEEVPYAFEKRVIAQLRSKPFDIWAFWSRTLWRAAGSFATLALLLGIWSFVASPSNGRAETSGVDLEQTVMAPLYFAGETW